MTRPLVQIDDEVREMTEEEHAEYLQWVASVPKLEGANNDLAG
jgi:hypothetical protein